MDTNEHQLLSEDHKALSVERSKSRLLQVWEAGDNYFLKVHNANSPILKRSTAALLLAFILNLILCSPLLIILSKFNNTVPFLICCLCMFGLVGSLGALAALISRWGLTKAGFPISIGNILSCWNAVLLPSILFGMLVLMLFLQFEVSPFLSIPLVCGLPGLIGGVTALLTISVKPKEKQLTTSQTPHIDQ